MSLEYEERLKKSLSDKLYNLVNPQAPPVYLGTDGYPALEGDLTKENICKRYGIPEELYDYVEGENWQEIDANALKFSQALGVKPYTMPLADPEGEMPNLDMSEVRERRIMNKIMDSLEEGINQMSGRPLWSRIHLD